MPAKVGVQAIMFRLLIQDISDIVVVIDAEGIIRFSTPQLEKVLGLRTEDVVGRNIFDFIHPDDERRARLEYSETVRKPGEGVPSILRVRDAGGAWIPFEIIANNQLDHPDIRGVIFTARDFRFRQEVENAIRIANADVEKGVEERITELAKANATLRLENQSRREAERRLQETISLLNATLNSTADGILVVARDGKVSGCNRRFIEMWHLQCGDSAVGRDDAELLSSAAHQLREPDDFIKKVQALYSDPGATSFDVLSFKDGRIYERYSQPQRLEDRIVGRVWSFRDVTEARRLEDELRQSQKLEALGRLAGAVAHDFNNLLMLISGYLGRLSDSGLSSEQNQEYEQAMAATKRAAALTRQLLVFSRKHRDAPIVTNLNAIVSNMQAMLRFLVSEFIRLDILLSNDPVPVLVDVLQLEVVLMNLAINAHDAMPDGGVVSVVTGRQEQDSRTFAVFTITDTGKGMTPEVRARIFEPFFTTKEAGKGTGLGLSTVYGIVQRLGGHIEVESEPHQGTQFRVYLPETKAVPSTSAAIASPVPPARGHETILLAEDEAGIRAMTRAYLEGLGYHMLEASDGLEAVKISREYHGAIDLILADLLMPIMRGDAVVLSIRESRPGIKALYISGCSEDLVADESAEVLLKPFEFPELGRRVRSILDFSLELRKPA
jgi:two-component system cell cycle sensor histidine kinase/response regulator CckA